MTKRGTKWLALLSTITLHALLLYSFYDDHAGEHPWTIESTHKLVSKDSFLIVRLIKTHAIHERNNNCCEPSDLEKYKINLDKTLSNLLSIESEASISNQSTSEQLTDGMTAAETKAYRQYAAQIRQKIERIWEAKRGKVSIDFKCTLMIKQNNSGEIIQVEFNNCGSNLDLKQSLFKATQAASPLPPPGLLEKTVEIRFSL